MPQNPSTQRLQWRHSSYGIWKRDLDECEIFYRAMTRKESGCYPVTGSASFTVKSASVRGENAVSGDDSSAVEDAFRKAWITLRHRHPTLTSWVAHDVERDRWVRVYQPQPAEQDDDHDGLKGKKNQWLQMTFKVIRTDDDALTWFNRDAPDFKHPSVYLLHHAEDSWSTILRCPHDITDGVGVLHLLEQLFVYAAHVVEQPARSESEDALFWTCSDSGVRLSPCLRVAAGIPETPSDAQSRRLEDICARNGALYNHAGLLGLPFSKATAADSEIALHGRRERIAVTVPREATAQILRRCKTIASGVSVTHVFTAALALVLSGLQPRKDQSYSVRYVNHSMINLRPYCRQPYNGTDHAAAAYHTVSAQALAIDLIVPGTPPNKEEEGHGEDNLRQISRKVAEFFSSIRPQHTLTDATDEDSDSNCPDQIAFAPATFKSITPPPGVNPHAVSNPPFCPVPLSSIGNISAIVSKNHGVFEVERVWAASEPTGAGVALFLGTWDGELGLSAVFDSHPPQVYFVPRFSKMHLKPLILALALTTSARAYKIRPFANSDCTGAAAAEDITVADNTCRDTSIPDTRSFLVLEYGAIQQRATFYAAASCAGGDDERREYFADGGSAAFVVGNCVDLGFDARACSSSAL
ncbi:uncharacterized protein BJX67DRAFT_382870 [Aspergillus lucknowensis]|uniref:Uncharacterized protein n=1 Tax=Aspergillus lucknowensis TaxID=176173 RepID=A0ABR4LLF5_9EURO